MTLNSPETNEPRILSVQPLLISNEVAAELGLSRKTVNKLVCDKARPR